VVGGGWVFRRPGRAVGKSAEVVRSGYQIRRGAFLDEVTALPDEEFAERISTGADWRCAGLHCNGGYFIHSAFHHSFPCASYLGEAVHVVMGAGGHGNGGSGAEPVDAIVIRPGLGVKHGVGVGIFAIVAGDFIAAVLTIIETRSAELHPAPAKPSLNTQ
jgi:hypothetical protein